MSSYLNYKYLIPAAVVIALLVLGGGGYLYYQKSQVQLNPNLNTQDEVKKVVAKVSKLIDLPVGEEPTVATVTDITKLKDQSFFAKAKNGDKVLIYTNAKKAILYDPTLNKVLDVAPINIGSSSAQTLAPAKIALRNGTTTVGLTTKVELELKKTIANLNVVSKENAKIQDYEKTTIILINDSFKDEAALIAKALNATIGTLPAGEVKPPDADVLIILGKDRI